MASQTVAQTPSERTPEPVSDLAFRTAARALIRESAESLLDRLIGLHEAHLNRPVPVEHPGGDLLLQPKAAARLLGVSSSRFFELKRHPEFPRPVPLPGIDAAPRYYRRADIEAWVASLRPAPGGSA